MMMCRSVVECRPCPVVAPTVIETLYNPKYHSMRLILRFKSLRRKRYLEESVDVILVLGVRVRLEVADARDQQSALAAEGVAKRPLNES